MPRSSPLLLLLALLAAPAAAVEPTRLVYRAAPGCPDATALRAAVADTLGRDPFEPAAARAVDVEITAEHATVRLVDAAGRLRGERVVPSPAADCAELVQAAGFTAALVLDPFALPPPAAPARPPARPTRPPPAAPTPARPATRAVARDGRADDTRDGITEPTTPAKPSATRDDISSGTPISAPGGTREGTHGMGGGMRDGIDAPRDATPPPPEPRAPPPPVARAPAPPPEPAPLALPPVTAAADPPATAPRLTLAAALGLALGFEPGVGAHLDGAARLTTPVVDLALGARFGGAFGDVAGGRVQSVTAAAHLAGCRALGPLDACLGALAGYQHHSGSGYAVNATAGGAVVTAFARVGWPLAAAGRTLTPHVELHAPLSRTTLTVDGRTGWHTSPVAGVIGVTVQ